VVQHQRIAVGIEAKSVPVISCAGADMVLAPCVEEVIAVSVTRAACADAVRLASTPKRVPDRKDAKR